MPVAPPRPPRARPARRLLHGLGVAGGWVGFVWLWWLVARRPWQSADLVWLIVGSLVVAPLVTAVWVWHNRSIYRRKGNRRSSSAGGLPYTRDWHGREVRADWPLLLRSARVVVDVEAGRKVYAALPASPGRAEDPGAARETERTLW